MIHVDTADIRRVIREIDSLSRRYPDETRSESERTLSLIALRMEGEVVRRTPAGVGGSAGLRGSISGNVSLSTGKAQAVWGTPLRYGSAVEYGRPPGTFPPPQTLELWVRRKLGVPRQEAPGVAIAVAIKIFRKGTEGAEMFGGAWEQNRGWVYQQIAEIPGRIIDRVNNGI